MRRGSPRATDRNRRRGLVAAACAASVAWLAAGAPAAQASGGLAPPPPGSYALPSLGPAADGEVLASDGSPTTLHGVFGDRVVLLSLVYTHCHDAEGCPLALSVLHRVRHRLRDEAEVSQRLRIVTLSFDPDRDTPEVMRRYGEGFTGAGLDWQFLTTRSTAELSPILDAYGQSLVSVGGDINHVLRVFLIDGGQRIRNVYSASYLDTDRLVNDVLTLLLEDDETAPEPAVAATPVLAVSGDDRRGYERADFETRSSGLEARRGVPADLVGRMRRPQLGLPPVPEPADNPVTAAKVALGRKLFFDRRLSRNGTISCAMCHVPEQGFASNETQTAVGIEGRTVRRNTPTLYNAAYLSALFHDGRESRLEHQIWGPLLAPSEMGNAGVGVVLDSIASLPDYAGSFEEAFPGRGLAIETVGMALASYERTLVAGASPFDRWFYGGDAAAVSEAVVRGFDLFRGKGACATCHTLGPDAALFTDSGFHNTGVGYRASLGPGPAVRRVQVAPGEYVDVDAAIVDQVAEPLPSDLGRYEITQEPADRWRYRTPTLRNVALTAPYMHDGSLATLRDVVDFYDRGGIPNPELDPAIRPLGLAPGEAEDLVAFLQSLTGGDLETLVADAYDAPIGERR